MSIDIPKFKPYLNTKYKSPNHNLSQQNTKVAFTKQNTKSFINPYLHLNQNPNQRLSQYNPQKPINHIKVIYDTEQVLNTNQNTMSSINYELERKNMFDYNDPYINTQKTGIIEDINIKMNNEDYNSIKTQPNEPYQHKTFQSINNDNRLEYALNALNLDNYLKPLKDNKIKFDDLFLLTREDMKEMNIPIGPRNRLLSFMKEYSQSDKKSTIEDIKEFCIRNQNKLLLEHCSMANICMTEEAPTTNTILATNNNQQKPSIDIKVNQIRNNKRNKSRISDSPNNHFKNINTSLCHKDNNNDRDKTKSSKGKELSKENSSSMFPRKRILSNELFPSTKAEGVSGISYLQCHNMMSPPPNIKKRPQMMTSGHNLNDYEYNTNTNNNKMINTNKEKTTREKHLVLSDNNRMNKPLVSNNNRNKKRTIYNLNHNDNSHSSNNHNNAGELSRLMKMETLLKKQLKECSISISEKRLLLKLLEDSKYRK